LIYLCTSLCLLLEKYGLKFDLKNRTYVFFAGLGTGARKSGSREARGGAG
jgi:hypothetical protein